MKLIFSILILLFLSIQTNGQISKGNLQVEDNFIQQIENVNTLLKQYATFSPFPEDEIKFEMIDSVGIEIIAQLLKILNDKRILKYQIETLFTKDELMISKSEDNKIYFLSIDEKTGGSYRTSKTIIHYRLANGTVKADLFEGEMSEALKTSTYGQIYLLDNLSQKYFIIGGVQVCNTCKVLLAIIIQLDTNSINTELIAHYDGRYYDLQIFDYDSVSKEFNYEFYSAGNDDLLYGKDNEKIGLQHRYKSKFKYLNGAFIEIEKCEFLR
jgi:hypothetical protein